MKGVHEHLVLRGYKCEDLFDTGGICQGTSCCWPRMAHQLEGGWCRSSAVQCAAVIKVA